MVMLAFSLILVPFTSVLADDYIPPTTPVINSFTASETDVTSGETISLSWDVSNAKSIEILGLEKQEESLPLVGQLDDVWPTTSTTYILNAFGENGSMISKTIDVNVDVSGSVEILSFTSSSQQLQLGETAMLHWKVLNAKSVKIYGLEKFPEGKDIPIVEGDLEVFPLATTTYVLQALGFNGEIVSKVVTVSVFNDPVSIESLTINPDEIKLGETAKISWTTKNAVKVNISGISKDLPANGSIEVKPTSSGTIIYTVKATGALGDKYTKTISLKVTDSGPKITNFSATSYSVSRGELVTISWNTENAIGCTLITSDGATLRNRPPNGKISLTPNSTKSYTLIAHDADGNTAEKTITIKVR
jgi:hypothetical protein